MSFSGGYWGPGGEADPIVADPAATSEPVSNVQVGPGGFDASLNQALNSGALQEAPGDPKELIAATPQANGAEPAPAPENIVGAPEMGPPAPQPATDAILAKMPAAPVGSGTTTAGTPDTGAAPVTGEKVIDEQHALDLQAAEDAKRKAEAEHIASIDHQADVQDAIDHGNTLLAGRQKAYDDALSKYNGMQMRDYWDQPGHSKMIARLKIAMGGFGAALSARAGGSTENVGITQIDKDIERDTQQQRARIEQARDSVVMAKTGLQDAKEAKAVMLEDVAARRTATLESLETEARQDLANRGIPAAQIDNDQRVLQLQAARVKAARDADEQKRKDAMAAAQIKYLEARAGKAARGAGAGGGGGGAGKPGAIAAFKQAIVDGKDGRPLNAAEIQAKADELGIPAVAKAGRPSVENLTKDVAFVAGQKTKADAADQKRADKADADLQKELYPAGGRGPGTQLERIEAMRSELKDAIASGDKTAATRVLEEAGGMLSGGKSTKNTVHLLEELKSSGDKMSSMWGRITGNPGDSKAFTQRLDKLLDGAAAEKRAEIEAITKRHEERRNKGGGASEKTFPAPSAHVTATGGLTPETEKLVRAKYNDPATSSTDRAKAALILTNAGLKP